MVGSGSTAAAIREELRTGLPVSGSFHSEKDQGTIKYLEKLPKNNPNADPMDRAAAENVLADIKDALGL